MTPVWIVVIVVVGLLVVGGLLVAMVRWLRKSYDAEESAVLDRLRQEAPRRGWTFEERADHHTEVFDELERYPRLIPAVFGIDLPPTALRAHDVVTGQHRGRPFLAARFHVNRPADGVEAGRLSDTGVLWVRTPAPRPTLDVRQVLRAESAVNAGLGLGDLRIGHPEFDARFQVTAQDERFARAVLTPGLVDFLLRDPRGIRGFWFRGAWFDVHDVLTDHRDPAELVPALDLRCDLLDRVPRHVWA